MLIVDRAQVITQSEAMTLEKNHNIDGCMVYIGGPAMAPVAKSWTPDRVTLLRQVWQNFLPVWVSPTIGGNNVVTTEVDRAVAAAISFDWHPHRGRGILLDTERSVYDSAPDKVFAFLQAWATGIYNKGYIPYQYGPNELLIRLGNSAGTLPLAAILPYYIQHTLTPVPLLGSRPELNAWAHGARAGWQYANSVLLIPGHSVFDVSTVSLPLNP